MNFLKFSDVEQTMVDPQWLAGKINMPVDSVRVSTDKKMGGLSAEIKFLDILLQDGKKLRVVVKAGEATDQRAKLGLAREALFYNELSQQLVDAKIPLKFFAESTMETGEMFALLEAVEDCVPAGTFFGSGNPNNWGVKHKLDELCAGNPTAVEVTTQAFQLYARLHGRYWKDETLKDKAWLRAVDWMNGQNEVTWREAQSMQSTGWSKIKEQITSGTATIQWDPHLVACLDVTFAKVAAETAFATYVERMSTNPFTLVQGDCHPHNLLWSKQRTEDACLRVIDFEMVGVGPPGQELGQFVISHMEPDVRRQCEDDILRAYYEELQRVLLSRGMESEGKSYTMEDCVSDYVSGGVGRWAWFIPFFAGSPAMAQYFHDQLAAFLKDHVKNPEDSPMPRV
jgi:aminoglycoside phosphotransferase (APT) family kinase protein